MATMKAEEVTAAHDNGPDWERREKAFFQSRRGNKIWYRTWSPKDKPVALLFVVHGLHSHSGRWSDVAHYYTQKGYRVSCHDHIGHGLTAQAGLADGTAGLVDDFSKMVDDFAEFVEMMVDKEESDMLPVFILGHSMGSSVAILAINKLLENAHLGSRIKKLVVTGCPLVPGPAAASPFGMRSLFPLTKYVGLMQRVARLLAWIDPKGNAAPIDKAALSKDGTVKVEALVDPLMVKGYIRNKTAYEIIKMLQAVREIAHKVTVPTLIMHGAEDEIAYQSGSDQLRGILTGCESVRMEVFPGMRHEVLRHKDHFDTAIAVMDQHLGS